MSLFKSMTRGAIGGAVRDKSFGRGLFGSGLALLASRVALRSVPGAALIGGGLLAKHLWDKKRERDARNEAFSSEDADMAIARAEGELDIAEGAMPGEGVADVA